LPAIIAVSLLVGCLRLLGQHAGLYGTIVGVGLMTVVVIVISVGLLMYFARSLDRNESERLAAQAQLTRNARHFELSRDMACTASFDGYYLRLNAAWTETLGWTLDELRSRPFVEFVHPDDRERTERETAGLAEGGVTVDFTNRYATKDGGWRWIDWQAMASMDDGVIYASARDVTDRKLAETALAASAHQTRQILDMAHEAFVSIDAQGAIIDWNLEAESTFGWSRNEVLGRPVSETIIPEGHRDAHDQGIRRFLATGEQRVLGKRLEMTACHRDGRELPIELTICPLETEQGITFNAFLRDISECREVERAKDEFISIVSHELRTPLTSIRGSLGLLAGGVLTTAPDKAERMLEIAIHNTDRLVRLINDILDIERIESGRVQLDCRPCLAARLVDEAVDTMRAAALQAGVTLHVRDGDEMLWADPDRVLQTLTNLISNAIKFSPPGATVWLEYEPCDGDVIFRVRDEGRGIPADSLERVFERFAQIDSSDARDKGGTGLGLTICRSIVEQHGGRIWGESVLGQGTTFLFTLPALAAAVPDA
jgi:PAS domain S-box-containing protein